MPSETWRHNELGHLEISDFDIKELVDEYGTPLFIFFEERLRENFRNFLAAFSTRLPQVKVYYSIKTNNIPEICRLLADEGAFAEATSALDFHAALISNFPGSRIILDGIYKPDDTLRKAIENGVSLINVESEDELRRINLLAREFGVRQAVGIRLSLRTIRRVGSLTDPEWTLCYPNSRFGMSVESARKVSQSIKNFDNVELRSLMMHPHTVDIEGLVSLYAYLRGRNGFDIRELNLGGGFAVPEIRAVSWGGFLIEALKHKVGLTSHRSPGDRMELVAEDLTKRLLRLFTRHEVETPVVSFEPGKNLVGSSGIVAMRVVDFKKLPKCNWTILDGGTNLGIHGITETRDILLANRRPGEGTTQLNVAGPLMYRSDILALRQRGPFLYPGDVVVFPGAGAYSLTMSTQFMYPRPNVLLARTDGRVELIRRRETYEEALGLHLRG